MFQTTKQILAPQFVVYMKHFLTLKMSQNRIEWIVFHVNMTPAESLGMWSPQHGFEGDISDITNPQNRTFTEDCLP